MFVVENQPFTGNLKIKYWNLFGFWISIFGFRVYGLVFLRKKIDTSPPLTIILANRHKIRQEIDYDVISKKGCRHRVRVHRCGRG
jgi:hypothetical protein